MEERRKQAKDVGDDSEVKSRKQAQADIHDQFRIIVSDVNAKLDALEIDGDEGDKVSPDPGTFSSVNATLLEVEQQELSRLQELVNSNMHLLPSYDVQTKSNQVQILQNRVNKMKPSFNPRPQLKSLKRNEKSLSSNNPIITPIPGPLIESKENIDRANIVEQLLADESEIKIADKSGETISVSEIMKNHSIEQSTTPDLHLANLKRCTIYLDTFAIGALRVNQLTNCEIYVACVNGSSFFCGIKDCEVYLSTRQLRVHNSHRSSFYLNIVSRPIIEFCSEIGFGSLVHSFHNSNGKLTVRHIEFTENSFTKLNVAERLLESTESKEGEKEASQNMWREVDDFRWLKKTKSPNWHIIGQ